MTKTNKSVIKRVKITKNGKIMRAGVGINHFQAKKTRSSQMQRKRWSEISEYQTKQIQAYLKH